MNRYHQLAWQAARTIHDLMNLMYKRSAAGEFKEELIAALHRIKFKNRCWELED